MRHLLLPLSFLVGLSSAAVAQEREWQLDATDQDAFLVFGVPQSDDVGVSFWCKLGSKKIKVMAPLPSGKLSGNATIPVVLQINGKDFSLRGRSAIGAKGSQDSVEAETPAKGPLLDALQATDRFGVKVGNHTAVYPLLDADLSGLLRLCLDPPGEVQQ